MKRSKRSLNQPRTKKGGLYVIEFMVNESFIIKKCLGLPKAGNKS